jgi:branched-chain amino acid transport system substrate-binding protein
MHTLRLFLRRLSLALATIMFLAPGVSLADITIAVVGGMSGPFEKIGQEFQQGTRGAVHAINEAGGLLGQKVKFIFRDDHCKADEARAIAAEFVQLEVNMVMGHLCSDASIAASVVYENAGLIAISPSSTNPELTERGLNFTFRVTGRDDMQGFVLAEHILRNFKTRRLAILYDDNGYSKGVTKVAQAFVTKGGMKVAMKELVPADGPWNFSEIIEKMRANKIDLVLYPGLPGPIMAFAQQIKAAKFKVRMLGSDAFTGLKFDKTNR